MANKALFLYQGLLAFCTSLILDKNAVLQFNNYLLLQINDYISLMVVI